MHLYDSPCQNFVTSGNVTPVAWMTSSGVTHGHYNRADQAIRHQISTLKHGKPQTFFYDLLSDDLTVSSHAVHSQPCA